MGATCSKTSQNCCFSCVLLCYACREGGIGKLQNKFAFFPPTPPTYGISDSNEFVWKEGHVAVEAAACARAPVETSATRVRTRAGDDIAVFFFRPPGKEPRLTLLWSHGNAMDIGEMYGFHVRLALELNVNVVSYDYSGYGASSGRPSERALYDCIDAVYGHLTSPEYGIDSARELVVYGQSVGSGPSVYLATRAPVCALVLHSPVASGIRVLVPDWTNCCSPVNTFACFDPFNNYHRAPKLRCPTLLMHGTADEVVDSRNTAILHARMPAELRAQREPYWVRGAGHDNLAEADFNGYVRTLRDFFAPLHSKLSGSAAAAPVIAVAERQ